MTKGKTPGAGYIHLTAGYGMQPSAGPGQHLGQLFFPSPFRFFFLFIPTFCPVFFGLDFGVNVRERERERERASSWSWTLYSLQIRFFHLLLKGCRIWRRKLPNRPTSTLFLSSHYLPLAFALYSPLQKKKKRSFFIPPWANLLFQFPQLTWLRSLSSRIEKQKPFKAAKSLISSLLK